MTAPSFKQWISPSGRIDRKTYWTFYVLATWGISIVLQLAEQFMIMSAMRGNPGGSSLGLISLVVGLVSLFLLWVTIVGVIKRFHDFDWSGWAAVVIIILVIVVAIVMVFVAFVGAVSQNANVFAATIMSLLAILWLPLLFTVIIGLIPGTAGHNRFGPAPGGSAEIDADL